MLPHTPGNFGDEPTIQGRTLYEADLIARFYRPWRVALFRWGAKLGPLTLYAWSAGVGWTWMAGRGHELLFEQLMVLARGRGVQVWRLRLHHAHIPVDGAWPHVWRARDGKLGPGIPWFIEWRRWWLWWESPMEPSR